MPKERGLWAGLRWRAVAKGEIKKNIKQKHPEFAACGVVAPGRHIPLNCENSVFPNIHSSLVNRSSIDVSCDEWFHFKCPASLRVGLLC